MPGPLKRSKALQPLSHDHHHGLRFCRKIRQDIQKNIPPERILFDARQFFEEELYRHFRDEEEFFFPLLGLENPLIQRACREHRRLKYLFFEEKDLAKAAGLIAEEMKAHIRFEERVLFNEIQKKAGAGEWLY